MATANTSCRKERGGKGRRAAHCFCSLPVPQAALQAGRQAACTLRSNSCSLAWQNVMASPKREKRKRQADVSSIQGPACKGGCGGVCLCTCVHAFKRWHHTRLEQRAEVAVAASWAAAAVQRNVVSRTNLPPGHTQLTRHMRQAARATDGSYTPPPAASAM